MTGIEIAQLAVLAVFGFNAMLLLALIALKTVHRRRMEGHDRRRSQYVTLISRHLTFEHCTDPISPETASDPAFLDALIDVRNAVVGADTQTLSGIIDRHGIVGRLMRRLDRRRPLGSRLRAVVALAELGDRSSARYLVGCLDDTEPEVRIQAARGLGRMQWTPAIDSIVDRFSTETPWVRSRFADTLVGFGSNATSPLAAYIEVNHHHETAGPVAAIRTLAAIGDGQAVPALLGVLDEAPGPEVRLALIETLGLLGSPTAVEPLQRLLDSDDWRTRAKTATALGELGDTSTAPLLAIALTDSNWWVRRNSAAALARLPGASDHLYAALDGADRYAADAAAEALFDRGDMSSARDRIARGEGTERDHRLVRHMEPRLGVPA